MHIARFHGAKTESDNVGAANAIFKKQIPGVPAYYFGVQ